MAEEGLADLVGRVLREAPFAMRQLAADSGLSYDVLRSWRSGRRRPSRASVQRLAQGLEQRGQQLLRLSEELRESAGGSEAGREGADRPSASQAGGSVPLPTPQQSVSGGAVHGTGQTSVPRTTGATHMSGGNFGRPAGGEQTGDRGQASAASQPRGDAGKPRGDAERGGGTHGRDGMAAASRDEELKPQRHREDWEPNRE